MIGMDNDYLDRIRDQMEHEKEQRYCMTCGAPLYPHETGWCERCTQKHAEEYAKRGKVKK